MKALHLQKVLQSLVYGRCGGGRAASPHEANCQRRIACKDAYLDGTLDTQGLDKPGQEAALLWRDLVPLPPRMLLSGRLPKTSQHLRMPGA